MPPLPSTPSARAPNPTVADLINAIEAIAPPALAEPWDNTGLLLGDRDRTLDGPVLLTIDLTESVTNEAARARAGALVSYHPPLFAPISRLTGDTSQGRALLALARINAAVYSPHTALDAATGGITDWLADGLMTGGVSAARRALTPLTLAEPTQEVKIVTFVPGSHVEQVRAGLASAGAGRIGDYELCSFALAGRGTFLAGARSTPAIGRPGILESVDELRLEMVCSKKALGLALETLRQFHPYQEPAIDVYELVPKPRRSIGAGRKLTFDHPVSIAALAQRLKQTTGTPGVQVALASGVAGFTHEASRVAIVPGSGGSLVSAALADGCDAFVTGEMKHHDLLDATARGLSVLLAGHTETERGYLPILARTLGKALPGVSFLVSTADRAPAQWV